MNGAVFQKCSTGRTYWKNVIELMSIVAELIERNHSSPRRHLRRRKIPGKMRAIDAFQVYRLI